MTINTSTLNRVLTNGAIAPQLHSYDSSHQSTPSAQMDETHSLMATDSLARSLPDFHQNGTVREDGVRIYYLDNGSRWYVTRQQLDDGSLVYYGRLNGDRATILRYNSSNPSTGYVEVEAFATSGAQRGYLNGTVNLISKNGEVLADLEAIAVNTTDMDYGLYLLLR
jgi:hypothetical protein